MRSKALHHFPHISFKGEEKLLWNPVLKKAFKNLPEERVRLQLVDYLIEESGFSQHRISLESPVKLPRDKSKSRTDLICYNDAFNPLLLVECKAPEIRLDAKVALQIARYNQQVEAPFLLVTNGLSEFWFSQENEALHFLDVIPEPFNSSQTVDRNFEYWSKRGFAGKNSHPQTRIWITESCLSLFCDEVSTPKFFSFEGTSPELGLANYYQIFEVGENNRLALSLSSTPFGATRLNAILNNEGENVALLSVSLDLVASEEPRNTIIHSASGFHHLDIKDEIGFGFEQELASYVTAISDLMD
ncbi:MAG: type I restriction enzyme HsdR N-terminal domain-containing protein [Balneolaceae bacterium]|nr:type I restriction enzyme HsdR N-terminal domain-containing protein [Balneolaceae bacterium]MBO6545380.1 type I restriction enzyme HsdR N-terminal domain-containing protein [Balneolaceae bacterium]MBO6646776.1 type I restriction enzyme HsdR N-terminal domain-containing protein [Balneolaceae bacterium]